MLENVYAKVSTKADKDKGASEASGMKLFMAEVSGWFAQQYIDIPEQVLHMIKHCRKSLLHCDKEPWKKKKTESSFNVTLGSFDGAKNCKLVNIHIIIK